MRSSIRVATCALLLTLAVPCFAAGSGVSMVDAAWTKAIQAGDVPALVKCYAADAVLWVPGGPMAKGSKEIKAAYEGYLAAYTVKDAVIKEIGSKTVGANSVAWGTYTMTTVAKAGGSPVTETGRYTEVAKRVGKKWVYTVDHASDDPAPAPAASK
jgi:ketosteroid isomerase-like protein